jgi:hypothetical protein
MKRIALLCRIGALLTVEYAVASCEKSTETPGDATPANPDAVNTIDSTSDIPTEGGATDWESCGAPGDCALVSVTCCNDFFVPANYTAVNRAKAAA